MGEPGLLPSECTVILWVGMQSASCGRQSGPHISLTCILPSPNQCGSVCALGHSLASELPQTLKSNFVPSATVCSKATSLQEAFQKTARI